MTMNDETLLFGTLRALFQLARTDLPADAGTLAARLGVRPVRLAQALLHLERKGLVDAGRVRLTLHGLAVAASLDAALRRRGEAGAADRLAA